MGSHVFSGTPPTYPLHHHSNHHHTHLCIPLSNDHRLPQPGSLPTPRSPKTLTGSRCAACGGRDASTPPTPIPWCTPGTPCPTLQTHLDTSPTPRRFTTAAPHHQDPHSRDFHSRDFHSRGPCAGVFSGICTDITTKHPHHYHPHHHPVWCSWWCHTRAAHIHTHTAHTTT